MNKVDISIIVPAYHAEKYIGKNLQGLVRTLKKTGKSYEVICVVDGKVDKTYQNAKVVEKAYPNQACVFGYKKNEGKGYAVRYGMKKARGKILGFVDSGNEIQPESLANLLKIQKERNADIVVGSKWHPDSNTVYPFFRKLLSFGYLFLVKALFDIKVSDTQAGIKIYKREVIKKVLPRLNIKGYAFDIEILTCARKLGFKKIYEAPIKVTKGEQNQDYSMPLVSVFKATIRMFWDTLSLRIKPGRGN